jgi:hypothetical protein
VLSACSVLPGKQFAFGFPAHDGLAELPGVLTDTTGAVTRVTTIQSIDPVPPMDRGMMTLGGASNALIAYWIDACSQSVGIAVTLEGGVTVTVTAKPKGGACDLVGIRRYVRIDFAAPLDESRTTIRFVP